MNTQNILNKVVKTSTAIQQNRYVSAISTGLMATMPLMMVGAIGSIFNQLSIPAYQNFLVSTGLKKIMVLPNEIGTNLFALFAVFSIAYQFAHSDKKDGLTAGILALMAFLFITPLTFDKTGAMSAIPAQWLGAAGLFGAMIVGLLSARLYCFFIDKNIVIKMPDSVPPVVTRMFGAILPGLAIAIISMALSFGFSHTKFASLHGFIYQIVAVPLTGLGSTLPALLIAVLFTGVMWTLGIHGTMITLSVFYPIWASIDMKNLAAFNSGHPAVSIVSMQFFFLCAFAGGAGNTLGLVLNMLTSKLPTNRALGKLALVPGIFGINEPIIFGMPIVMNPLIAVPFIFGPLLSTILGYIITKIGLIAMPTGISSITGAPIIVNQFLQGGWTWGVWTIVLIALSYVMYLPFFKAYEKTQLTQGKETQEATLNNVAKGFEDATK